MNSNVLNESNFFLYAAHHYLNPCVDEAEFQEDLGRIKTLRRLFNRYEKHGELKDRLILNHLVILYNVFEHRALTRMLVFSLSEYIRFLKPFLLLMNYWPEDSDMKLNAVVMDSHIINILRKI